MFENYGEKQTGNKAELLSFIKNTDHLAEPLTLNFASLSESEIVKILLPYWYDHVSRDRNLSPLENAKIGYPELTIMPIDKQCFIDEYARFCFDGDQPLAPILGLAQNGGVVLLYPFDIVWFYEPSGFECWGRMN